MSTVVEAVYSQPGQAEEYVPLKSDLQGNLSVDTLMGLGLARQLAAGAASVSTALTTTCRRVSVTARLADIRFVVGTGALTASATSHYIAMGERLDFDVPANANLAVIRAGTADAVLEVSELVA
jgi:hypothetical protein